MAERLACSPPTEANRVQYPAESLPDFFMFPLPFHSDTEKPSSALKISLLYRRARSMFYSDCKTRADTSCGDLTSTRTPALRKTPYNCRSTRNYVGRLLTSEEWSLTCQWSRCASPQCEIQSRCVPTCLLAAPILARPERGQQIYTTMFALRGANRTWHLHLRDPLSLPPLWLYRPRKWGGGFAPKQDESIRTERTWVKLSLQHEAGEYPGKVELLQGLRNLGSNCEWTIPRSGGRTDSRGSVLAMASSFKRMVTSEHDVRVWPRCWASLINTFKLLALTSSDLLGGGGGAADERLACSPPTKANRVRSPGAGSLPDSRMWELMPDDATGWRVFSGISHFPHHSILTSPHSGSQDVAVKSHPNLFTHSLLTYFIARIGSTWLGSLYSGRKDTNFRRKVDSKQGFEKCPDKHEQPSSVKESLSTSSENVHENQKNNIAGAAVAERLARSPPTKANRAQSPAGSPDLRKW
ncbi:hypothetical protein PR048_030120 [Dryococelus australis]|uniref:Uncharacterized protein n=1 Tax=Dryococelus australis TaxID=614101 RepID=A0ABQ9G822_9NEOP|nr:hypothetical protein PR048_030120 [Dryococelus australis]